MSRHPLKLPTRMGGFTVEFLYVPCAEDAAQALPAQARSAFNMLATIAPRDDWSGPAQIFLRAAAREGSDISSHAEELGTFMSLLLRRGMTVAELVKHTKRGGLGRAAALVLQREFAQRETEAIAPASDSVEPSAAPAVDPLAVPRMGPRDVAAWLRTCGVGVEPIGATEWTIVEPAPGGRRREAYRVNREGLLRLANIYRHKRRQPAIQYRGDA